MINKKMSLIISKLFVPILIGFFISSIFGFTNILFYSVSIIITIIIWIGLWIWVWI